MCTYEQKKKSCEKRMIPFLFTREEWDSFHKLKHKVKCAYTNAEFVHKHEHSRSPSLERIDENKGYSVYNCVWICQYANELKSQHIENNIKEDNLTNKELETLRRVRRIIGSPENIKAIQEPYKHLFTQPTTGEEPKKMTTSYDYSKTVNQELNVAKLFSSFGCYVEQTCQGEFNITFSQFKMLLKRKRCMLTLRELPEDLFARGFFVKDKTKPVTKDNLFVTTKELQSSLDNLCVNANLDITAIKLLGKALGK